MIYSLTGTSPGIAIDQQESRVQLADQWKQGFCQDFLRAAYEFFNYFQNTILFYILQVAGENSEYNNKWKKHFKNAKIHGSSFLVPKLTSFVQIYGVNLVTLSF